MPAAEPIATESGEVTLGGLADRGLTLAALYDTGVLERLRLEVRVRLMADLTQSLAWLHANPRLMASHPHLLIAPTTVVIGLDGVARVDVRAAKKRTADQSELEGAYAAPEVANGNPNADHRADIFSLGVLTWEALAGRRLIEATNSAWMTPPRARTQATDSGRFDGVPVALGPARTRELAPVRRTSATLPAVKVTQRRFEAPPPLTLPPGGEWAVPIAEVALLAMSQLASQRPADCRTLLTRFDALDPALLASHQEIAEVVQGISGLATLCVPEPALPNPDTGCQTDPASVDAAHRAVCEIATLDCMRGDVPDTRRVPTPTRAAAEAPSEVSAPAQPRAELVETRKTRALGHSPRGWFFAGLLWLLVIGSLAGYVASVLAAR